MPTGPKGQKRPADVIGNAVRVMRLATGEETEELDDSKMLDAKAARSKGGKARRAALTPEQREEIARVAAEARWKKS